MNFPWFRRRGFVYIPVTLAGWLILIVAVAYALYKFRTIDQQSHSVSDTLINWGFQVLILAAVYTLIGYRTSKQ